MFTVNDVMEVFENVCSSAIKISKINLKMRLIHEQRLLFIYFVKQQTYEWIEWQQTVNKYY